MSSSVKEIAKRIQERSKELGYDLKLTHAYELLASIEGHKSWNVMSAKEKDLPKKNPNLSVEVKPFSDSEVMAESGKYPFNVKVKALAEVSSRFVVKADNIKDALRIASEEVFFEELTWEPVFVEDSSIRVTDLEDSQTKKYLSFEDNFQKEFSDAVSGYEKIYDFYAIPESFKVLDPLPTWEGLKEKREECEKGLRVMVQVYEEHEKHLQVILMAKDKSYKLHRYFLLNEKVEVSVEHHEELSGKLDELYIYAADNA